MENNPIIQCPECDSLFVSEQEIQDHYLFSHTDIYNNTYECHRCDRTFSSQQLLDTHLNNHSNRNNIPIHASIVDERAYKIMNVSLPALVSLALSRSSIPSLANNSNPVQDSDADSNMPGLVYENGPYAYSNVASADVRPDKPDDSDEESDDPEDAEDNKDAEDDKDADESSDNYMRIRPNPFGHYPCILCNDRFSTANIRFLPNKVSNILLKT